MRARWIFNAAAGSAGTFEELKSQIESIGGQQLCPTEHPDHTAEWIGCSHSDGFDTVIACGGDGTVNSVVAGLMKCGDAATRPALGVLPIGTGNDFARTLGVPLEASAAVDVLQRATTRLCDVVRARDGAGLERFYINVGAGGFSGQVNEKATDDVKSSWGPLAYLRSAVSVLPELTRYKAALSFDDAAPVACELINVIVANARTAAGGTVVAPQASIEDGLLDVVLVHGGSLLDLAAIAAHLFAGDYTAHDRVELRRCRTFQIESDPPMAFNVDGDLLPPGPLRFEVVPAALRVLVGPEYAVCTSPANQAT